MSLDLEKVELLASLLYQDLCTSQNHSVASRPADTMFGLQGSQRGLHAFVILVVSFERIEGTSANDQ